jgi:SAM-dependent MidA family methyltransferase
MSRLQSCAVFSCGFVLVLAGFAVSAAERGVGKRQLVNPADIYREIKLPVETETAVSRYFPSFLEYQEEMLYDPKFGYYGSGRVNFSDDYRTFPNALAPYFGQMVAQQIFRMWDGMRRAGTLGRDEKFTIAELGAGTGLLAESILDYLRRQSQESNDMRWREFNSQAIYICYDRSPALREVQRRRNLRFGGRFEALQGDATNLTQTIKPGTLKGVLLSNELLDVFGVHKVILLPSGSAEVAFVLPLLPRKIWNQIKVHIQPAADQTIISGDHAIQKTFLASERQSEDIYLSRETLPLFFQAIAGSEDYASIAHSIRFHEVYLPARVVPELAEHLKQHAQTYARELARIGKGVLIYINLGEEKFIRGASDVLKAGYVLTIDYGSNWDGIMSASQPHLRTYGPGNKQSTSSDLLTDLSLGHASVGQQGAGSGAMPSVSELGQIATLTCARGRGNPDPYRWPSLNDITTDVNFGVLAAEGQLTNFRTVYFGPQKALHSGTSVSFKHSDLSNCA